MTGSHGNMVTIAADDLADLQAELDSLRSRRLKIERDIAAIDDQIELLARRARRTAAKGLRSAALRGDAEGVRKRLASPGDLDVNARNRSGATALFQAVHCDGNEEVVGMLLEAGADPNLADFDRTVPLLTAVRPDQLAMVKLLVEAGAAVDVANGDGDTPLTNAAAWGAESVVRYLLEKGADPTLVDGVGLTAAQLARQQGYDAVADLLDASANGRQLSKA